MVGASVQVAIIEWVSVRVDPSRGGHDVLVLEHKMRVRSLRVSWEDHLDEVSHPMALILRLGGDSGINARSFLCFFQFFLVPFDVLEAHFLIVVLKGSILSETSLVLGRKGDPRPGAIFVVFTPQNNPSEVSSQG